MFDLGKSKEVISILYRFLHGFMAFFCISLYTIVALPIILTSMIFVMKKMENEAMKIKYIKKEAFLNVVLPRR